MYQLQYEVAASRVYILYGALFDVENWRNHPAALGFLVSLRLFAKLALVIG